MMGLSIRWLLRKTGKRVYLAEKFPKVVVKIKG